MSDLVSESGGVNPTPNGEELDPRTELDRAWMLQALQEADQAPLHGDVPVGCVVVDEHGVELSRDHNRREERADPTAHAELLALRRAAAALGTWRLEGCALVVTLEPCTMCAGAVTLARVGTLVFGAWEPKTGAVGSLYDVVRDPRVTHRPEVYAGVLADKSAALLRAFFSRPAG